MNEQVMKNWITTLRMGGYRQCQGTLRKLVNDKWGKINKYFCSVGVLLEMCDPTGWARSRTDCAWSKDGMAQEAYMTRVLGFPADMIQNVIRMNDQHHMSFGEIADYLEGYMKEKRWHLAQNRRPSWKDALVANYNQKEAFESLIVEFA